MYNVVILVSVQGSFSPIWYILLQVLQSLPENWSVHVISQFLSRAVRKSMNLSRNTRIERMMSRGENLRVKQTSIELQREFVTMNDDRQPLHLPVCQLLHIICNSDSCLFFHITSSTELNLHFLSKLSGIQNSLYFYISAVIRKSQCLLFHILIKSHKFIK